MRLLIAVHAQSKAVPSCCRWLVTMHFTQRVILVVENLRLRVGLGWETRVEMAEL